MAVLLITLIEPAIVAQAGLQANRARQARC
jgi:hypothetical protein